MLIFLFFEKIIFFSLSIVEIIKKVLVKLCNLNYNENNERKNIDFGGYMKDFISKNWKKIFYIIGGILIAIDLFFLITTPGSIPQDFLKYGPDVESDIFDNTAGITEEVKDLEVSGDNLLPDPVEDNTLASPNLVKGLIIFGIVLIVILAFSATIEGSGSGGKKKK